MNHKVFLGLGSNLGSKFENLKTAINALCNFDCLKLEESSIYISDAWGFKSSEPFLNMVILIKTNLSPQDLLAKCKQIELDMGRKPKCGTQFESRLIDLDILYYDDLTINVENLQIPHQHIKNRLFVLKPLLEVINNDHTDIECLIYNKLQIEKKIKLKKFIH